MCVVRVYIHIHIMKGGKRLRAPEERTGWGIASVRGSEEGCCCPLNPMMPGAQEDASWARGCKRPPIHRWIFFLITNHHRPSQYHRLLLLYRWRFPSLFWQKKPLTDPPKTQVNLRRILYMHYKYINIMEREREMKEMQVGKVVAARWRGAEKMRLERG
jgi:hypothetical protein